MQLPDTHNLPLPVFVADPEGRIETTNEAFERLLPGRMGSPWLAEFAFMDQRAAVEQRWRNAQRHDQPFTVVGSVAGADGALRIYTITCQPLPAGENLRPHYMGLLLDITEQMRSQAEVQAILETAVDAIIMIDEHGAIENFNTAASNLFGYSKDEILGQSVTLLMPEPHRARHGDYMRRYLETGQRQIIGIGRELEALTRSGKRIPVYLAVSEIELEGRRSFTGIIRDLSEQYAAREALSEQREKLAHVGRLSTMGEMTASIAHEINQPLTAISMYAQSSLKLIQRGNPDLEKLAVALDKLNTQSLRAGAIIERIQRFARPQQRQRELLEINELMKELVKLAEGDARLHNVTITFDLEDGLPPVFCDAIQIQQVALNLIRNAIDAMTDIGCRNGSAMAITSRSLPSGAIEVSVVDQGPGVAQDQSKLLFKPFHTTKKEGMGMGLSICRTIIGEHGGELAFRNNPDVGSTFYFTLPAGAVEDV
jgi:two-component system, LuxR family, sensor kinase FixL